MLTITLAGLLSINNELMKKILFCILQNENNMQIMLLDTIYGENSDTVTVDTSSNTTERVFVNMFLSA